MPEYKPDQCPDCGCARFKKTNHTDAFYKLENNGFGGSIFNMDNRESGMSTLNCAECESVINESESIEQGKIVLA